MFGLCALNRAFLALGFFIFFVPGVTWGQSQLGTVVNHGASVYKDPDFDAPLLTQLKRGEVFTISKGKKGPFYKIRVKPGSLGWIADTDIQVGQVRLSREEEGTEDFLKQEESTTKAPERPFFASRYRGVTLDYINFTEDTVGGEQSQFLPFIGMKFSGFDTLVSGEIYTESNLLLSLGAPSYYEDVTKGSAQGFILIGDFLFQTPTPRGKSFITFFGLGPMIKYSHFELTVPGGGTTANYTADDVTLGVVVNYGFGYRMGRFSLRGDGKYYWEKKQYIGLGLSLGMEF